MTNGVMNGAMNRKLLILDGLVAFTGGVDAVVPAVCLWVCM